MNPINSKLEKQLQWKEPKDKSIYQSVLFLAYDPLKDAQPKYLGDTLQKSSYQAACLAHEGIQLKHTRVQPRIAAQQYGDKIKLKL